MIKKLLLAFLIGFITGFIVTGVSTKAFSENRVQYIEKSFDNIRAEFFAKAEKIWDEATSFWLEKLNK